MAGEAKNPTKVMPRAVVGTIAGTAVRTARAGAHGVQVLSIVASLGLVGMLSYTQIDSDAGFASGFRHLGWSAVAHIAQAGEVLTLPIVVFIAFLAQPRLLFAMANDGLAPQVLGWLDQHGNIFFGTLISGVVLTAVALCVPFNHLDDMVSAGVLVSFSLCNCCLLMLRYHELSPGLFPALMWPFVACSVPIAPAAAADSISQGVAAFLWQQVISSSAQQVVMLACAGVSTAIAFGLLGAIWCKCPQSVAPGTVFRAPYVPVLPGLAIFFNWALLAQLSTTGLLLILGWIGAAVASYMLYGFHNSKSAQFALLEQSDDPSSLLDVSLLDTDLYRAPVRSTAGSGWMYNQRRDRSCCLTIALLPHS